MRRRTAVLIVVLAALAAFVYFRPLTLLYFARDLYLRGIGMRSEFVQVGPHRIHYFVGGEGPPLVMVHGVATRAADGALIYRSLLRSHRIYAPDLLGYGESDRPRDAEYSVTMQAEIIRGFIDAMRIREPDVMGVSMGGWIALRLAADDPTHVRRLVLVSSAGLEFPTTLRETTFSPDDLDGLRASLALQSDRAHLIPAFVLRDLLRRSKEKSWVTIRSMRSMLAGRDLLDRKLQRVRMPVLLVYGTADRIVPFALAARMQQEMPQAQLVALEGCGHLAIVECRDRAIPAIEGFLVPVR